MSISPTDRIKLIDYECTSCEEKFSAQVDDDSPYCPSCGKDTWTKRVE